MSKKTEDSIIFLLFDTNKYLKDKLLKKFSDKNINASIEQFALLQLIKDKDGVKQQELADKLGKDKTTMVRLIDSMQKKALVRRVRSQKDVRQKLIYISDLSRSYLPVMEKIISEISNDIQQKIGQRNVSNLKSQLKGILNLEDQTSLF